VDVEETELIPNNEEPIQLEEAMATPAKEEPIVPAVVVDKLLEKERNLQAVRQVLAVFDAMGPAKAPKKCDRPFTGRQQEVYQDCYTVTADNHANQLLQASLYEKFDLELAAMEAVLIAKGLTKSMESFKGTPFPEELNLMKTWHMELEAFETMRVGVVERFVVEHSVFKKIFDWENLSDMVEYVSEEASETLSFFTRRRGKAYKIIITLNMGEIDLKVEPQEVKLDRKFESAGLRKAVGLAMKKRVGARKLIRDCIWNFVDKLETIASEWN